LDGLSPSDVEKEVVEGRLETKVTIDSSPPSSSSSSSSSSLFPFRSHCCLSTVTPDDNNPKEAEEGMAKRLQTTASRRKHSAAWLHAEEDEVTPYGKGEENKEGVEVVVVVRAAAMHRSHATKRSCSKLHIAERSRSRRR